MKVVTLAIFQVYGFTKDFHSVTVEQSSPVPITRTLSFTSGIMYVLLCFALNPPIQVSTCF